MMSVLSLLMAVGPNAGASAANSGFATLTGQLPFGSANLEVEALTGTGAVPILSESGVSGSYSVTIPDTSAVAGYASANNGILNVVVLATSGTQLTSEAFPVSVGGSATVPPSAVQSMPAASLSPSSGGVVPAGPDICLNLTPTYDNNHQSRIGEMHVANQTGISAVYSYQQSADSTFTVGLSIGGGAFSIDGTSTVSNAISGATNPEGQGFLHYIDDHMNYIKQPNSCGETYVYAYSSNGDVPSGTGVPGGNPWGHCQNAAPYWAELNPAGGGHDGTYYKQKGTSQNYSIVATVFTFNVGGSTGYSTTDQIEWFNSSSVGSWVCGGGTGGLDASPIIYNSPT
ncbi:MAG: hypothetical protein ACHQFZ_02235 [Acidimicrobiales bacterium]